MVAAFTLNNSLIELGDQLLITGVLTGYSNYSVTVKIDTAGQAQIAIRNVSAGSLSEAVVLNFVLIKGATS